MTGHEDNMRNAAVFAESVRREMRNLPAEQVADLTDGIEADMVASLADGGSLPDAVVYAHDLMRAAGIEVPAGDRTGTRGRVVALGLSAWSWLRHSVRGLAPAWWVFRAWVLTQVIGWLMGFEASPYWFAGQWGEREAVAVIVFVVLVSFSVRIGRDGWLIVGRTENVLSVILALASVTVLVSRHSQDTHWFEYGSPGGTVAPERDCSAIVPELVGAPVATAVEILLREGFEYEVVDMTGFRMTNSAAIGNFPVLSEDPHTTEMECGAAVMLMIDPSGGRTVTTPPGYSPGVTSTTVARVTTTTLPKSASSVPEATSTTTP